MKLKHIAASALLPALLLALGANTAMAAEKTSKTSKTTKSSTTTPASTTPAPAQAQPAAAAPQVNPVTQSMSQLGVSRCLPRINQFMNFLIANGQAGVIVFTDPSGPDQRLSSVSMEIKTQNATAYVSATFAPTEGANECGGMYEAITYWANNCNEVGSKAFEGFTQAKPLRQQIATLEKGPFARVYLMAGGPGCISVKKEIVF